MFVYYDESILTISSSICKYCDLDTHYLSDKELDTFLKNNKPNKIINIIIDGLGANALNKALAPTSFLAKNQIKKMQTVLPSAYALKSIIYGESFNQFDKDKRVDELNVELVSLNKLGHLKAIDKTKLHYVRIQEYKEMILRYGVDSLEAKNILNRISDKIKELKDSIDNDVLVIICGDCGYIDINRKYNLDDSKYINYFESLPVLENRCVSFFIKEEKKSEFEKEFKAEFENDFILLTKQQVIDSKLFGYDDNHQDFIDELGSHLAIAKSDLIFESKNFVSEHKTYSGGILDDELYVPLIII